MYTQRSSFMVEDRMIPAHLQGMAQYGYGNSLVKQTCINLLSTMLGGRQRGSKAGAV
jgi:hypothetical protein